MSFVPVGPHSLDDLLSLTNDFVFSGDIGRWNDYLLHDPKTPKWADFLFIESTYGNKLHKEENVEDISYTGRVTQDTLEKSKKLKNEDSLPSKLEDVPIKRSWKKFSNQSMDIKDKYVVEGAANKEGEHNNAATYSNDIKADPVDDSEL